MRELEVPPIHLLPTGSSLADQLGLDSQFKLGLRGRKLNFEKSSTVHVLSHWNGIGDAVNDLRHVEALASVTPSKDFFVYVPKALSGVEFSGLPKNITVAASSDTPQQSISKDNPFFMTFSPIMNADSQVLGDIFSDTSENREYIHNNPGRFLEHFTTTQYLLLSSVRRSFPQFAKPEYSWGDTLGSLAGRLLGVDIGEDGLRRPIFNFTNEPLPTTECDMLIVPDAKEGITKDTRNVDRSLKSLSLEQWENIFSLLPSNLRYSLAKGISHPDYCDAIAEVARRSGKQLQYMEFPSLNDFVKAVWKSKVVVGMDSGTTHLAGEVSKAASLQGRQIAIREIFNGDLFDIQEYGIRGLKPGNGKILEVKTQSKSLDIGTLPPSRISQFIQTGA